MSTKIQTSILFVSSGLALAAEILSLLALIDAGWSWSPVPLATAATVAWCAILGLYFAYLILSGYTIQVKSHLRWLLALSVAGYAILSPAGNGYTQPADSAKLISDPRRLAAIALALPSATLVACTAAFQAVLVAENDIAPSTPVNARRVLLDEDLPVGSAAHAALLAFAGLEAAQATLLWSHSVRGVKAAALWGETTLVFVATNLAAKVTRRYRALRTIRAELFLTALALSSWCAKWVLAPCPSTELEVVPALAALGLAAALVFEAGYVVRYAEGWASDGTLADMSGPRDLPPPEPVSHGPAFGVVLACLRGLAAIFALTGLCRLESDATHEENWAFVGLLVWNVVVLAYLGIHALASVTRTGPNLRSVRGEIIALAFLADAGVVLSIAGSVTRKPRGESVTSLWFATLSLFVAVAFETVTVKSHYGPLKEVGGHTLSELARWKADRNQRDESEEQEVTET